MKFRHLEKAGVMYLINKNDKGELDFKKNNNKAYTPPDSFGSLQNHQYVNSHKIKNLVKINGESRGYALYTYLLFPRRINDKDSGLYLKYNETLKALYELDNDDERLTLIKGLYNKNETNIIYIPSMSSVDDRIDMGKYNYNISRTIINILMLAAKKSRKIPLSNKMKNNEGPFLITTLKPLLDTGDPLYFMYADMTRLSKSAVKQVISTYKKRLSTPDKGSKPPKSFEKIKAEVLSLLTNLNADIEVILLSTAHAK